MGFLQKETNFSEFKVTELEKKNNKNTANVRGH